MGEERGNDDEAIYSPISGEYKSRLLRRARHPTSPLRTPRNDADWTFSTVPKGGVKLT
jgi:GH25 family lysozyme M1 (1,4-beta-N-acetylmuramidase)